MQSNYISRGCAVCVTTTAMSDQHREAGMGAVTPSYISLQHSTDTPGEYQLNY